MSVSLFTVSVYRNIEGVIVEYSTVADGVSTCLMTAALHWFLADGGYRKVYLKNHYAKLWQIVLLQ